MHQYKDVRSYLDKNDHASLNYLSNQKTGVIFRQFRFLWG